MFHYFTYLWLKFRYRKSPYKAFTDDMFFLGVNPPYETDKEIDEWLELDRKVWYAFGLTMRECAQKLETLIKAAN